MFASVKYAEKTFRPMLLVAVLLTVVGSGCGSKESSQLDPGMEKVIENGIPGVAVLVDDGARAEFYSKGAADLESGDSIEQSNHFRVASVSKAFNGAVILSLVDEGRVDLDDTAGKWLRKELPRARKVTIAQMLQHTGGIPDYTRVPEFGFLLSKDPLTTMPPREILSYVTDLPLEFEPGSEYSYSDSDNLALGLIAEEVTGETYDELLKKYVYERIGADQTSLPDGPTLPDPFTSGYQLVPGVEGTGDPEDVTGSLNPELAWASGGIVSTVQDLASLMTSIADASLYSSKLVKRQRDGVEGQSSPPGPGENVAGLGLFGYETKCGTVWGHTGSFPGYRIFAASSEDGKRHVVVYVNATETTPEAADAITSLQEDAVCLILDESSVSS